MIVFSSNSRASSEIDLQTASNFHQMLRVVKTAGATDSFGTFGAIFPCAAGLPNFFSDLGDRAISANFHSFEKTQNPLPQGVWVRVPPPAPRRSKLRTAQKTQFRKSWVFFVCASLLLLFPSKPASTGTLIETHKRLIFLTFVGFFCPRAG